MSVDKFHLVFKVWSVLVNLITFIYIFLKQEKIRDNIKTNWCQENHIPLIRIPYTHLDQLTIQDLQLETSPFIMVMPT